MRSLIAILLIVPVASEAAPPPAPARQPDILVTGENRVVCRHVARTATRMRVGRLCRRLSDWRAESDIAVRDGADPNATIDGAADTIELLGKEHGTGDGEPGGHEGPHGPRQR